MPERVWKRLLLIVGLAVLPACGGEAPEPPEVPAGPDVPNTPGRFHETPDAIPGQYIVVLKDGAGDVAEVARALTAQYGGSVLRIYSHALRGFLMQSREEDARALTAHPLVDYVSEDGLVSPDGT
jgi:serine protease